MRAEPWNQLLKIGLCQTLARCIYVLNNDPSTTIVHVVDDYRSTALPQFNVMEVVTTSPIRVSPCSKAKRSVAPPKVKGSRGCLVKTLQKNTDTSRKTTSKAAHRSGSAKTFRSPTGCSSSTRGYSGRRTGGEPRGTKTLI